MNNVRSFIVHALYFVRRLSTGRTRGRTTGSQIKVGGEGPNDFGPRLKM